MIKRLAVLDDYQGAAFAQPYWKKIENRIELEGYRDTLHDEERIVERLRPYQILVPIRERTHFSKRVLEKLPESRIAFADGQKFRARGSGRRHRAGNSGDANGRLGRDGDRDDHGADAGHGASRGAGRPRHSRRLWQTGIGFDLAGKTLGVIGLGRIGSQIAAFGNHLGMRVLAWSENLTPEKAAAAGATYTPLEICSGRAIS